MHITGKIVTNLDGYEKEVWPSAFVTVPRVGSYIRSASKKELKVLRITHYDTVTVADTKYPRIEIEVGK